MKTRNLAAMLLKNHDTDSETAALVFGLNQTGIECSIEEIISEGNKKIIVCKPLEEKKKEEVVIETPKIVEEPEVVEKPKKVETKKK